MRPVGGTLRSIDRKILVDDLVQLDMTAVLQSLTPYALKTSHGVGCHRLALIAFHMQ